MSIDELGARIWAVNIDLGLQIRNEASCKGLLPRGLIVDLFETPAGSTLANVQHLTTDQQSDAPLTVPLDPIRALVRAARWKQLKAGAPLWMSQSARIDRELEESQRERIRAAIRDHLGEDAGIRAVSVTTDLREGRWWATEDLDRLPWTIAVTGGGPLPTDDARPRLLSALFEAADHPVVLKWNGTPLNPESPTGL